MKQIFYKIIYNQKINFFLRNINKIIIKFLPISVKIPPSGIIKLDIDSKKLKIKTNQTNFITQLLYWEGYHNFEYTDIFLSLINKIEHFYDIGANIGYYSLLASVKNPNIRIVSFEPARGPLYYLEENVKINKLNNIKTEPIALSHNEGDITFYEAVNRKYEYLEYNLGGEGNAGSKTEKTNFIKNKVSTTTLDNYVKVNNVSRIDLIKMDTEGTENLILEHSKHVLRDLKPVIICETLFNTIESELENIMSSYDYLFYNHVGNGLRKVNSIKRETDDGVRNCFFVHPTKLHLIEEFILK